MVDLSREFAVKLGKMVESSLINYKYYELWCDEIIENLDEPPIWIIELESTKLLKDAEGVIYSYAYSYPFIEFSSFNIHDFCVACLYVRYKRRHISWASFLLFAGQYSDGNDCTMDCGDFYFMLNKFEDNEYSLIEEANQSNEIKTKFYEQIEEVNGYFDYFLNYLRKYLHTR